MSSINTIRQTELPFPSETSSVRAGAQSGRSSSPVDTKTTSTAASVFQTRTQQAQSATLSSKEYASLKSKFREVAEKKFDKTMYSSTYQGKHDGVREAFVEEHATHLLETFLKGVNPKTGDEVVADLHAGWGHLLDKIYPKDFDFKSVDENHPFKGNEVKVQDNKGREITFTEKGGNLSATVDGREFATKDKGVDGILKLYSKIVLSDMNLDQNSVSKVHKLALNSFDAKASDPAHISKPGEQGVATHSIHGSAEVADKTSGARMATDILSTGQEHGIGTGALSFASGMLTLKEAIETGKSDKEFFKLYKDFKANHAEHNPPLSASEKFELAELDKCVAVMKKQSAVIALGSEGVLKVLSGSADVMSGVGTVVQCATLASVGGGLAGGLLIVSGSLEMAEAASKLRKLTARENNANAAEQGVVKDLEKDKDKEYKVGLVKNFIDIQANMIGNEKTREHLNFTNGGGMVAAGTLLTAGAVSAVVAGGSSFGIGAAVVLGGVAISYTAGQAYLLYTDHKIEKLQTELLAQDIAQVRKAREEGLEDPFKNMRSTAGVLMELSQAVMKEQEAKKLDAKAPTPISEHIVKQYMGVDPEAFVNLMAGMDKTFMSSMKDPNAIGTGVYIKNEGLARVAQKTVKETMMRGEVAFARKASGLIGVKAQERADKGEVALKAREEQRALDLSIKVEEGVINKGTEKIAQEKKNILAAAGQLIPAGKAIRILQHRELTLTRSRSSKNLGVTVEPNVQQKIDDAYSAGIQAAKKVLSETDKLALYSQGVREENVNAEHEAKSAIESLEQEIGVLTGMMDFTARNSKVKNEVETYNYFQEQHSILTDLRKETMKDLDRLNSVVASHRSITRSEFSVNDSKERLRELRAAKREGAKVKGEAGVSAGSAGVDANVEVSVKQKYESVKRGLSGAGS